MVCVHACVSTWAWHSTSVKIREQFARVYFLLPPCQFQFSHAGSCSSMPIPVLPCHFQFHHASSGSATQVPVPPCPFLFHYAHSSSAMLFPVRPCWFWFRHAGLSGLYPVWHLMSACCFTLKNILFAYWLMLSISQLCPLDKRTILYGFNLLWKPKFKFFLFSFVI